ncbi:hypothetical protein BDZ45DRAFT_734999 [Acephala macrosclerotiorum]|nr:hypothetical protein BDZ45DRAFT_734999 [Acephala macrosclerotiorum]
MRLLSILTLLGKASAVVFEAENATITGDLYVATDVPGFSGTGYIAGWDNATDTLQFNVTGLTAGSYDIAVVYSAQHGNKYTSVSVNGAASAEVAITNVTTSNWASPVGSFSLTAGTNTVLISNDWGWYFIDPITVVPTLVALVTVVDVTNGATAEAENGILNGVTVATSTAGYSGSG